MPRPTQLPTPQSSTQPIAQDGGVAMGECEMSFELPESAFKDIDMRAHSLSEDDEKDADYQPPSPRSKAIPNLMNKRKRKEAITLPPPPGRARKIIEMKPSRPSSSKASTIVSKEAEAPKKSKKETPQPSRKISRKTAHSLIERRRRGKMNDEFEVLKDMVPACQHVEVGGREMHKLEILKASVEYIRYLKDCVCQLQGHGDAPCCPAQEMNKTEERGSGMSESAENDNTDVEMELTLSHDTPKPESVEIGKEPPIDPQLLPPSINPPPTPKLSPATLPQIETRNHSISSITSPLSIPTPASQRNYSSSSASASSSIEQRHYSFSSSNSHSYNLSPPTNQLNTFTWRASTSEHTSPVMAPLPSQENDATVALLMLNGEWASRGRMGLRDESCSGFGGRMERGIDGRRRGLSVKDLLSS